MYLVINTCCLSTKFLYELSIMPCQDNIPISYISRPAMTAMTDIV